MRHQPTTRVIKPSTNLAALPAYFIWPYKDQTTSIEAIFTLLQTDLLGGLISLDISMLLIAPLNILMFLVIYAMLKRENEDHTDPTEKLRYLAAGKVLRSSLDDANHLFHARWACNSYKIVPQIYA